VFVVSAESSISSVMATLGGGAGVDIRKLAEDLTNAERAPLESRINRSKEQKSAEISAYSVLKYDVENLISKFRSLDDAAEILSSEASSTDDSKVKISTVTGSARAGTHSITVSALATQQINISNSYSASSQGLNGGSGFDVSITDSDDNVTVVSISDGNDTPAGIVAAINSANAGVAATLLAVNTDSSEYRIVLSGDATGSENSFVVSSSLADTDLGFHDSANGNNQQSGGVYSQQIAVNASFTLDGVSLERASNTLGDVLEGVTVDLVGVSTSGATQIEVEKTNSQLKAKLQDVVAAYNSVKLSLREASNPESEDEIIGGALASDFAAVRQVRSVLYRAITQDSSTVSGSVSALRDIGIELTRSGDLAFNENKFDTVMSTSASDVSTMLSAGTNDQSEYDGAPQGLARDVIADLEESLTDSLDGLFTSRTANSSSALADYEDELVELEVRMSNLFNRYLEQFTVMETLVSQLNSTRNSLSETWANMGNFRNK